VAVPRRKHSRALTSAFWQEAERGRLSAYETDQKPVANVEDLVHQQVDSASQFLAAARLQVQSRFDGRASLLILHYVLPIRPLPS
jgi:hypothetical protein